MKTKDKKCPKCGSRKVLIEEYWIFAIISCKVCNKRTKVTIESECLDSDLSFLDDLDSILDDDKADALIEDLLDMMKESKKNV